MSNHTQEGAGSDGQQGARRMTPSAFAQRVVGAPWVKWRADFQGADCWGCVDLFHREVLGIDAGIRRQEGGVHGAAECPDWLARWHECALADGATFWVAWRHGSPTHCGVMLSARDVLHSEGSEDHPGGVRISRLEAVRRVYGEIRFYRYAPH